MEQVMPAGKSRMDSFVDRILRKLDGPMCRNCGQRLAVHAVVGAFCQSGTWYADGKNGRSLQTYKEAE